MNNISHIITNEEYNGRKKRLLFMNFKHLALI
jgi:hypothetical protein